MENTEDIFILLKKKLVSSSTTDLTSGLVAFWKLEENPAIHGTTLVDSSGAGKNATLSTSDGSTNKSVIGIIGNAVIFDGNNDIITFPTNTCSACTDFSFSLWAYQLSSPGGADMAVFALTQGALGSDSGQHLAFYIEANTFSDNSAVEIYTSGYGTSRTVQAARPPLDQWNHFVFTLAGTSMKLYINGSLANSITNNIYNPTQITPDAAYLCRSGWDGDPRFDGVLDEVRLYNRELSQSEVTQLYNLI